MVKESTETSIAKVIAQTNAFRNRICESVPITYFHNVLKLLFELKRLQKSSLFYFDPVDYEIISVQRDSIFEGHRLVECYESDDDIVILGHPYSVVDHDCLKMKCHSGKHILYRFKK